MPLIVRQYRRDRLLSRRIRELLRTNPKLKTAEEITSALHVSTRSMFRHLADEGTSLQQLKDEVRHEVAVDQLLRTAKTIKQVADATGFSNEASFSRRCAAAAAILVTLQSIDQINHCPD
jgi:AraC-like DNA-binding protein